MMTGWVIAGSVIRIMMIGIMIVMMGRMVMVRHDVAERDVLMILRSHQHVLNLADGAGDRRLGENRHQRDA
jgi:hypothetical protein